MTIDEAIKEQTEMLDIVYNAKSPKRSRALKLGIEALKRIKWYRDLNPAWVIELLPGETEE